MCRLHFFRKLPTVELLRIHYRGQCKYPTTESSYGAEQHKCTCVYPGNQGLVDLRWAWMENTWTTTYNNKEGVKAIIAHMPHVLGTEAAVNAWQGREDGQVQE